MSKPTSIISKPIETSLSPSKPIKTPASEDQLPVGVWSHIIDYLPDSDRRSCALVSHRLEIIDLYDPSADLEKMGIRKAASMPQITSVSFTPGPSQMFLFSNPKSPEELNKIRSISVKMQVDPNVAKTVLNICGLETLNPEYIPFYHAMNLPTYVFSLFTRILLSMPYLPFEKFPCSSPLIRFPSPDGPKTVQDLFEQYPIPKSSAEPYDHIQNVQKELLCLNPHLFANFQQDGESTWFFYIENRSVNPPHIDAFFEALCRQYKIPVNQKEIEKLVKLHGTFCALGNSYARLNLSAENRETEDSSRGVVLQILAPIPIVDKVAYPSLPYGKIDSSSPSPLSKRCLALRKDPRGESGMQARMLAQSVLIPDHRIKVIAHGCGGFYSEKAPDRLLETTDKDWAKQKDLLAQKKKTMLEIRSVFSEMMVHTISKK